MSSHFNRKINLLQATSINMIDMVGIGPFLVMPFVVSQFNNGLFLCGLGFIFSLLFRLGDVISSILAMRILVQFIGQTIGLVLLREKFGAAKLPFKMWLYPLPVILSILIWLFVFISTKWFALGGSLLIIGGVIVFFIAKDMRKQDDIDELSF